MLGGRAGREGSTLCQMTTVAIARLGRQTRQPAHQAGRQARGSPAEFCFAIAQERLGPGRIFHCMRWLGQAQRAFDLMCYRLESRTVRGGAKLGSKQLMQQHPRSAPAEELPALHRRRPLPHAVAEHPRTQPRRKLYGGV